MLGQDLEQAIPPDPQPGLRLVLQQEMQLSRIQARLTHPHPPHELGYLPILLVTAIRCPIALVVRLTTQPHELASPANAQSLDLLVREDLPGRFFYDGDAVVILQHLHHGLKELRLLVGQFQLLLQLLDALLGGQWKIWLRHGEAPWRANGCPLAPILPTVFA
jgi:hypothetical protein